MNKLCNKSIMIFLLLIIFLFASFSISVAKDVELPITLTHREKIALTSETKSVVILVEQEAQESEFIIKERSKKVKNGIPINFTLSLERNIISEEKDYKLFSVIKADKQIIWSDSRNIKGSEILNGEKIKVVTKRFPSRLSNFYSEKGKVQLRNLDGLAQVIIFDQEYFLPRYRTASGVRYLNQEISVWNKGRELYVDNNEEEFTAKLITLKDLSKNFSVLTARGQEPPWQLKVGENELKLNFGYSQNEISISRNHIEKIREENELVYKVNTSFLDFEFQILEEVHRDIMSGEIYPLTMIININGQEYIGGAYLNFP